MRALLVTGGDPVGTLYAAYRVAEHMGVGFSLHGDAIPDEPFPPTLPDIREIAAPRLAIRGLLPFHDFPEGPDWWDRDDYLALIEQLPKLRLNFIGFHTYPEGPVGAEPTVWIGPKEDVLTSGIVKSAYPARYFTSLSNTWQMQPRPTSEYRFSAGELFSRDDFGSDIMEGMAPWPPDEAAESELFRRTGLLYADVFRRARELGIKTCMGTEIPLTIPRPLRARLGLSPDAAPSSPTVQMLYEGIFHRLQSLSPVDYYWFWSPESWLWGEVQPAGLAAVQGDLALALAALRRAQPPIRPVISGWVLGPQQDPLLFHRTQPPDVILAPLTTSLGFNPVDVNLAKLGERDRWTITWLEDDGAMILPQLWAGRVRRDVNDAVAHGCTGVIGLHWRTMAVGPAAAVLSRESWEFNSHRLARPAAPTAPPVVVDGHVGGFPGLYLDREIAGTGDDYIYQSQRYDLSHYRMVLPPGRYTVRLHFAELIDVKPGERVFDVIVQGQMAAVKLDLAAGPGLNTAHVIEMRNVEVGADSLDIQFIRRAGMPCIAAIEASGPVVRALNCGGKTYKHFESDMWPPTPSQRNARDDDPGAVYREWAAREFGSATGPALAEAFAAFDGRIARLATWTGGPGGLVPDYRPELYPNEGLPDWRQLAATVTSPGNRHRFEYWDLQFRHLAAVNRIVKQWGALETYLNSIAAITAAADADAGISSANNAATQQLQTLINLCATDMALLRRMTRTKGDLGTIANLQQHSFPKVIDAMIARHTEIFGVPPAVNLAPDDSTTAPIPLIVPTVRGRLAPGEPLRLTVIAPAAQGWTGQFFWRPLGRGEFQSAPMPHFSRAVHRLTWTPPAALRDLEYYVEFTSPAAAPLRFPPTAPAINQTVLIH